MKNTVKLRGRVLLRDGNTVEKSLLFLKRDDPLLKKLRHDQEVQFLLDLGESCEQPANNLEAEDLDWLDTSNTP